uniref:Putative secreted protein n=1 Tax=Anopheles darlingi TaxID=43151 RepID=A0A2M4D9D6_ANODA
MTMLLLLLLLLLFMCVLLLWNPNSNRANDSLRQEVHILRDSVEPPQKTRLAFGWLDVNFSFHTDRLVRCEAGPCVCVCLSSWGEISPNVVVYPQLKPCSAPSGSDRCVCLLTVFPAFSFDVFPGTSLTSYF